MADILLSVGVQAGSAEFSSFISDLQSQINSINNGKDTEIKFRPTIDSAGFSEIKDQIAQITNLVNQISQKDFKVNLNLDNSQQAKEQLGNYQEKVRDYVREVQDAYSLIGRISKSSAFREMGSGALKYTEPARQAIEKYGSSLEKLETRLNQTSSFAGAGRVANDARTMFEAIRPLIELASEKGVVTLSKDAFAFPELPKTTASINEASTGLQGFLQALGLVPQQAQQAQQAAESVSEATNKIAQSTANIGGSSESSGMRGVVKQLIDYSNQIGNLRTEMLKMDKGAPNYATYSKQLDQLRQSYKALKESHKEDLGQADMDKIIANWDKVNKAVERARSNIQTKEQQAQRAQIEAAEKAAQKRAELEQRAQEREAANAQKKAEQAQRAADKEVEIAEKAAQKKAAAEQKEQERAAAQREAAQTRANTQYENQLYSVESALKRVEEAQERCVKSGFGESSTQYQGLENLKANLEGVKKEILEVGELMKGGKIEPGQALDRLSGAASKIKGANTELVGINRTMIGTGSALGMLESRLEHMLSLGSVIMLAARQIKNMAKTTIELDSAMTQLRVVTNASESDYEQYGQSVAGTAKEIGASITDLIDSTTVYARLGYSLDESSNLAKYTAMLSNVGDIDVSTAQDALTAITKAFKDVEASNIEAAMDKMVAVGNNFPISVSQIAEGMNNAGSALAAAGNSFQESIALLTAANTTVQNVSKSSTGLRTITARIRGTKLELDELGETIEVAKYQEALDLLTGKGVKLTQNGEFRSTYDILKDIASVWNDLSNMEQANIAEQLAGKICCCCPGALMKCAQEHI